MAENKTNKDIEAAVASYFDENPPVVVEANVTTTAINFDFRVKLRPNKGKIEAWLEKEKIEVNLALDKNNMANYAKLTPICVCGTNWPDDNQTGIDVVVHTAGTGFVRVPLCLFEGF